MTAPLPPADLLRLPVAHRAYHDTAAGRPENSRAAVRAAIAAGYAIEIDLQPSSDGVPMVFHDDDLPRLTGAAGPIRARSAADLARIALLHGDGETIPTLQEILEIVDGKVPLLIEIKDQDGAMGPRTGDFEAAVAEVLSDYTGPFAVMSFNPHSIAGMRALAPEMALGLTTCDYAPSDWPELDEATCARLRAIPDYDRVGASFISHQHSDLASPRVAELRAAGAAILCWTIRSVEQEAVARRIAGNVTFEHYPATIPA